MKSLTKYDDEFRREPSVKWDPWVGEHFHDTRILIVGDSTYIRKGAVWEHKWRETCETERTPNRCLIGGNAKGGCSPFKQMPAMFSKTLGKASDENVAFWSSVAFFNYHQTAMDGPECTGPTSAEDRERDRNAASYVVNTIKPALVIVWGVGLFDTIASTELFGFGYDDTLWPEYISGAHVRIGLDKNDKTTYVGIRHPSRGFSPEKWYKFLVNNPVTKGGIAKLEKHLRTF